MRKGRSPLSRFGCCLQMTDWLRLKGYRLPLRRCYSGLELSFHSAYRPLNHRFCLRRDDCLGFSLRRFSRKCYKFSVRRTLQGPNCVHRGQSFHWDRLFRILAVINLATVVSAPLVYADDVRCKHSPNGNFCDCDYAEYCCCQFHFA